MLVGDRLIRIWLVEDLSRSLWDLTGQCLVCEGLAGLLSGCLLPTYPLVRLSSSHLVANNLSCHCRRNDLLSTDSVDLLVCSARNKNASCPLLIQCKAIRACTVCSIVVAVFRASLTFSLDWEEIGNA